MNKNNDFIGKLIYTGRDEDEPIEGSIFTCLRLTEQEFKKIKESMSINQYAKENDISFVTIEKVSTRTNPLNFIHITSYENIENIEEKGLVIPQTKWISDLGKGIYVVEDNDVDGLINLQDYISELYSQELTDDYEEDDDYEETYLAIIKGSYVGKYYYCVYGYQHEGYILLEDSVESKNIIVEFSQTVKEFVES